MDDGVRELLPDSVKGDFDDIVEQRVLGASRHIGMIGGMIEAILQEGEDGKRETDQMIMDIKSVCQFFIRTRGEASQAVSNAILLMIHHIDSCQGLPVKEAAAKIRMTKEDYAVSSAKAIEKVVDYGVKLAAGMSKIFVYDYSSTVEKFLRRLPENKKEYTIYIAESRIIDGGKPFVEACRKAGHHIKFIPEASMMYFLRECDGAFMGAETFYPDGTGFNTTGSDIVALICSYYKIPLYFLTPFIKLDIRPVTGGGKNLVYDDLMDKLTKDWEQGLGDGIDFVTPELVGVKPGFIEAFVTEKGVIPSGQMYAVSMEYSKDLRGDI